jgi:hypothetical protein
MFCSTLALACSRDRVSQSSGLASRPARMPESEGRHILDAGSDCLRPHYRPKLQNWQWDFWGKLAMDGAVCSFPGVFPCRESSVSPCRSPRPKQSLHRRGLTGCADAIEWVIAWPIIPPYLRGRDIHLAISSATSSGTTHIAHRCSLCLDSSSQRGCYERLTADP